VRLSRRVRVHGRVQGVWFRDWTIREAHELGVDGWVRNRRDGTVEALVAGEAESVEALIAALRQGPPNARVDALDIDETDESVSPGFTRAATA
jgi:acylphosphatase